MLKLDKKGVVKAGILVLVVVMLLFFIVNGILSFGETAEEEKLRLEAELASLEEELSAIEGGRWVNITDGYCGVERIFYNNYNCDNAIGYHTVNKIKLKINEIKSQLKELEDLE